MHLYELPLAFALVGLALYAVLGGADFGAGFWELAGGRGELGDEIRDQAHEAMAPVWEANHVWLIFVLTVVWTAYPTAFGSIASTLSIPLFVAGIGIVLRGGSYALRTGAVTVATERRFDAIFGVSSILTPFALGTVVGAIASERVHVGNPGGSLITSWLNPTSIAIGVLAVVSDAYVAAVFLTGDAERRGRRALAERLRLRSLGAGLVAGAVAVACLVVLRFDAERVFTRLTHGVGTPCLVLSIVSGIATLVFVRRRRYEPARYTAAVAVAATIIGWGFAQNPVFLSDLTVQQAAAGRNALIAVSVAVVAGAVLLFPALALLFRLALGGRLESGEPATAARRPRDDREPHRFGLGARTAGALLVAGIGFLTIADAPWAHAVGVVCLVAFVAVGFPALAGGEP